MDDPGPPSAPTVTDVLVVGAGPAGVAAAVTLRASGRDVMLVDKATFPRDKCCGDGLTTLALRELEALGFEPLMVRDWQVVDGAVLRSPSGRQVTVRLPTGARAGTYAAVAPRRQLDAALVDLASAAGVDVRTGHGFDGRLDQHHDHAVVGLGGHEAVAARYVIAADGMWSPVRRAAGLTEAGYLGEWHAFRAYARGVTGPAAEQLHVWFEPDLLPGYAWSFPLPNGRVNIGFGVLRDGSRRIQDMKQQWADLLDRPHIRAAIGAHAALEDRHTAWPIPARIDRATLSAGRVLLVGDAAAATDVMTGEGIGQALLTGRLAAEAVVAAGAVDPAAARRHYGRAVRHHLVADHRMSAALGRVLAHERGARGAIGLLDRCGDWSRRSFARWMFEDEPRALLLTPSRWHRRPLARPGVWVHG
ncbi:MAG: NAD(P)/FAD-dependent oxidoreductase [Ilumatobacteraceae bacterium]